MSAVDDDPMACSQPMPSNHPPVIDLLSSVDESTAESMDDSADVSSSADLSVDDMDQYSTQPSVVFCNRTRLLLDDSMDVDAPHLPDRGTFVSDNFPVLDTVTDGELLDNTRDSPSALPRIPSSSPPHTPPSPPPPRTPPVLNFAFRGSSNPRDPRLNPDDPVHVAVPPQPLRGSPPAASPDSPSMSGSPCRRGAKRRKTSLPSKRSALCEPDDIAYALTSQCCTNRCVWFFTPFEVLDARSYYTSMDHYNASNFLLALIKAFYNPSNGIVEVKLGGHPVCITAFLLYHGISRTKWYSVRSTFFAGGSDFLHGNTSCTTRPTPQTDIIVDWINALVYCQGDPSPCSNEVYLPMSIVKIVMYDTFVEDCSHDLMLSPEDIPSSYMFHKLWRDDFSHVKWPKYTKLGKCDICTKIAVEITHCDAVTKRALRLRKKHHQRQNSLDRSSLSRRTAYAIRDPTVTLCLDQDYANQLRLPHQRNVPKSWLTKCKRPRLQIGGLIDHGYPARFLFLHFAWYKHDPNLSLTHLYCHLADLRSRGQTSSTFYLQADNCYKENKNKTTFAFLTMLVMMGWFEQVEMYFLSPGHTHGEVDRMFSRFGHLRKEHNCDTPAEFMTKWYKYAYRNPTRMPELKIVQFVYNWKGYFKGHYHENIQGHSRPRAFLFKKNPSNGIVQFWAKESALADAWIGRSDDNLHGWEILFSVPTGPVGIFRPVPLHLDKYRDVRKTYDWLSPEAKIWWEHFYEDQFFWLPEETEPPRGNVWDIVLPDSAATPAVFVPAPVAFHIRMQDHPPSSMDEIVIGNLIAVIPPDPEHPPSSDEDEFTHLDLEEDMDEGHALTRVQNLNEAAHPYWIGKVVGFSESPSGVRKAVLRYYKRRLNTPEDRKYELHDSRGSCTLESILLHGFTLTMSGLIRSVTMNKLKRILHL